MGITIYSVPHTGTRFVQGFYTHCGVRTSRRHAGHPIPQHDDDKRVIPVRNPYECYLSWKYLHPGRDLEFMSLWGRLMWRSQEGAFFFPLDIKREDRQEMLLAAKLYSGNYTVDLSLIESFEWNPSNESGRPASACPEEIKKLLSFAYEWYEYYTKHWGKHEGYSEKGGFSL